MDPNANPTPEPPQKDEAFLIQFDRDLSDALIKAVEAGQLKPEDSLFVAKDIFWHFQEVNTRADGEKMIEELKVDYPYLSNVLSNYNDQTLEQREKDVIAKLQQFINSQK